MIPVELRLQRQEIARRQSEQTLVLLEQNTQLTRMTQQLSERIEKLTGEMHRRLVSTAS